MSSKQNVFILDFIRAKDGAGVGGSWSYKTCKAKVKSPSTSQHPTFLQTRCPSCQPTNSVKVLMGKKTDNVFSVIKFLLQIYSYTRISNKKTNEI